MQITDEHKKILEYMDEEWGYRYHFLEKETGIKKSRIKQIMLDLKLAGYCEWQPFMDEEGTNGSGHLLTGKGVALKNELGIEKKDNDYDYD
ncbi:MAG: hypothetical protein WC737_05785 [Parcubacteria group bacterium]|jgi:hypothetical protein